MYGPVQEESPIKPLMEYTPDVDKRTAVVGPKSIARPGGRPVTFQVPVGSLQEVPQNQDLVLGEVAGSLPATPRKGLDLGTQSRGGEGGGIMPKLPASREVKLEG